MVEEKLADSLTFEYAVAKAIVPPTWEKAGDGTERWVWDVTKSPYNGLAGSFETYNNTTMIALAHAINAIVLRLVAVEEKLGIIKK